MAGSETLFELRFSSTDILQPRMGRDTGLNAAFENALQVSREKAETLGARVRLDHDVKVCGDWGFFLRDDVPDQDLMLSTGWSQDHLTAFDSYAFADQPYVIDELAVNILWPGVLTYGHWLLDTTARLELVRLAGVDPGSCVILLPANPPLYMREIASAFGFGRHVEVGGGRDVFCRQVVTPEHTRTPVAAPRDLYAAAFGRLRLLKRRLSRSVVDTPACALYVQHTPMTSSSVDPRMLMDEDVLLHRLAERGFHLFNPLSVPFLQQADIFGSAHDIIGVDSSALHNAVFAEPGVLRRLTVLSPNWRINYNHLLVAAAVDAELQMVLAEHSAQDGYFSVNPSVLLDLI